jgi:Flp pilus assembly protein protease CpaA
MREMRITNQAVLALGAIFLVIGLIALPFDVYLWRLAQLAIVLVVGIVLNAAGAMGAGDSKLGSRQEIPNGPCPCLNTGMLFGTWRSARRKLRPNYHLHPATILTE